MAHVYKIGKYEITNRQYGEFLNKKGAFNSYSIHNSGMIGITQSGNPGTFTYGVIPTLANHPVVSVSWFDAARFTNWLVNGQSTNDMETGAYTLNGAISGIVTANAGLKFTYRARMSGTKPHISMQSVLITYCIQTDRTQLLFQTLILGHLFILPVKWATIQVPVLMARLTKVEMFGNGMMEQVARRKYIVVEAQCH